MKIQFSTDNAAFDDDNMRDAIARILRDIARKVEHGTSNGTVRDVNGNSIGTWQFAIG